VANPASAPLRSTTSTARPASRPPGPGGDASSADASPVARCGTLSARRGHLFPRPASRGARAALGRPGRGLHVNRRFDPERPAPTAASCRRPAAVLPAAAAAPRAAAAASVPGPSSRVTPRAVVVCPLPAFRATGRAPVRRSLPRSARGGRRDPANVSTRRVAHDCPAWLRVGCGCSSRRRGDAVAPDAPLAAARAGRGPWSAGPFEAPCRRWAPAGTPCSRLGSRRSGRRPGGGGRTHHTLPAEPVVERWSRCEGGGGPHAAPTPVRVGLRPGSAHRPRGPARSPRCGVVKFPLVSIRSAIFNPSSTASAASPGRRRGPRLGGDHGSGEAAMRDRVVGHRL
jgi:hypothetical protein